MPPEFMHMFGSLCVLNGSDSPVSFAWKSDRMATCDWCWNYQCISVTIRAHDGDNTSLTLSIERSWEPTNCNRYRRYAWQLHLPQCRMVCTTDSDDIEHCLVVTFPAFPAGNRLDGRVSDSKSEQQQQQQPYCGTKQLYHYCFLLLVRGRQHVSDRRSI